MPAYLAHIKYEGQLVSEGYLDARKSAEILIGIDEILRYYIHQQSSDLSTIEFEIPIRIEKGSWMALLPTDLGEWIAAVIGSGVASYAVTALNQIAKNDFKDVTSKDIAKGVIKSLKWTIEIIKHVRKKKVKQFPKAKLKEIESEQLIGIPNENGEILYVPQQYLELYTKVPEKLLDKITKYIEQERELEIDFSEPFKGDKDDTGKPAKIGFKDKSLFYIDNEEDKILFPELKHGQYVELSGHITRGNEKSNTVGLQYKGHILTCIPRDGNIKSDKETMFTNCIMKGYVERIAKDGSYKEKKPRIKYIEITDNGEEIRDLFSTK